VAGGHGRQGLKVWLAGFDTWPASDGACRNDRRRLIQLSGQGWPDLDGGGRFARPGWGSGIELGKHGAVQPA